MNNDNTIEYLKSNFATKKNLDETFRTYTDEMKHYMRDLTTGFQENIKGVSDQVAALGEKMDFMNNDSEILFSHMRELRQEMYELKMREEYKVKL